jgi:hypothetical protein
MEKASTSDRKEVEVAADDTETGTMDSPAQPMAAAAPVDQKSTTATVSDKVPPRQLKAFNARNKLLEEINAFCNDFELWSLSHTEGLKGRAHVIEKKMGEWLQYQGKKDLLGYELQYLRLLILLLGMLEAKMRDHDDAFPGGGKMRVAWGSPGEKGFYLVGPGKFPMLWCSMSLTYYFTEHYSEANHQISENKRREEIKDAFIEKIMASATANIDGLPSRAGALAAWMDEARKIFARREEEPEPDTSYEAVTASQRRKKARDDAVQQLKKIDDLYKKVAYWYAYKLGPNSYRKPFLAGKREKPVKPHHSVEVGISCH